MAKTYELDKLDRQLIYCMDLNARLSNVQLAKQLHCSEHVVAYRLNRLSSRGLGKSSGAIINGSRLGLMYFRVYLRLKKTNTALEQQLIDRIVVSPYVTWVASLRGKYDLIFSIYSRSVSHFSQLLASLFEGLDDAVFEKNILLLEEVLTYSKAYLIGEKNPKAFFYVSSTDPISLDGLDKDIIVALSRNARTSNLELGKTFQVSPDTIRNRITKLTAQRIILGYREVFDLRKVECLSYIVSMYLHNVNQGRLKALQGFSQSQPNILFYVKCIGDHDLDLELEVENEAQLDQIINQLKSAFSDILKDYVVCQMPVEYKYTFFGLGSKDLSI